MNLKEIFKSIIAEGVYDPAIFKAIFIASGPGSGKSYIAQQLFGIGDLAKFSHTGLKLVTPDVAFEKMLKDTGIDPKNLDTIKQDDPERYDTEIEPIRMKAKSITKKTKQNYMDGRLGLLIETTGRDVAKIQKVKNELQELGYDTFMIFVSTTLEVAQARNRKRSRTLPDDVVREAWVEAQENLEGMSRIFGDNFAIIDNSVDFGKIDGEIVKRINRFINSPLQNHIAKMWVSQELKRKQRESRSIKAQGQKIK